VRVALLDYQLPDELVARYPVGRRDAARLMVVRDDRLEHRLVSDLEQLIEPGAVLVVNDTRVIPARLLGSRPSGARVELLLVRRLGDDRWQAIGRANKPLRPGARLRLGAELGAEVLAAVDAEGLLTVRLEAAAGEIDRLIEQHGHVPLPPYLGRADEPSDRQRYQTVYARVPGAVAAPTAGLHFTPELLARLEARGVERVALTLHVGPGTFRPVLGDDLDDHPMHPEPFVLGAEVADRIGAARARGSPVVAVGTTVVRALEAAADPDHPGLVRPRCAETRLLIQPGYRFRIVDALITNFHLPRSTLLALVYAFAGAERMRRAYAAAIAARYRFFSYGDAMLLTSARDG
jgi:S-adenosylmethionine:tRNA ribosyltransferase-isomerase